MRGGRGTWPPERAAGVRRGGLWWPSSAWLGAEGTWPPERVCGRGETRGLVVAKLTLAGCRGHVASRVSVRQG